MQERELLRKCIAGAVTSLLHLAGHEMHFLDLEAQSQVGTA